MDERILIVIPAYNEGDCLQEVLTELKKFSPQADVVLVDDGSADNTSLIASTLADFFLRHPYNLGEGAALQTGYKFAHSRGYDILIHFDADGQHHPQEIKNIIQPIQEGEADLVLGSRFLRERNYSITLVKRLLIFFLSEAISFIIKQRVSDPTSGFRAMNRKVLELFNRVYPCDYPEIEELLLINKKGLKLKEVPTAMRPRLRGKSTITPIRSIYYLIKAFLVLFIDIFSFQIFQRKI